MSVRIQSCKSISGAVRKQTVWQQITNFSQYQRLIPAVDEIRILEQHASEARTEWFMMLDGAPFTWIETDSLHEETYTMQTESISGDFDILRGTWRIEDREQGSIELMYQLEYELGIPVIEVNIGSVLKEKMQQYVDSMVTNHVKNFSNSQHEDRVFKRVLLDRAVPLVIDGRAVEAQVVNICRAGMMVNLIKGMIHVDGQKALTLQLSDTISVYGMVTYDSYYHTHRIKFDNVLSEDEFRSLVAIWNKDITVTDDMVTVYDTVTTTRRSTLRHQTH